MQEKLIQIRRGYFLLRFTENLIKNSKAANIYILEEMLKFKNLLPKNEISIPVNKPEKSIKEEVQDKFRKERLKIKKIESKEDIEIKPFPTNLYKKNSSSSEINSSSAMRRIPIPKSNIPPQFGDLRPSYSQTNMPEIDLGKLNPLIKDNNVRTIEVNGANQKAIVSGKMGRKPSSVNLNEEEIQSVIDKFSSLSRIPKTEGVYKVVYGNLVLEAFVSQEESNFLIKKL